MHLYETISNINFFDNFNISIMNIYKNKYIDTTHFNPTLRYLRYNSLIYEEGYLISTFLYIFISMVFYYYFMLYIINFYNRIQEEIQERVDNINRIIEERVDNINRIIEERV